jgi:type IV secretion system protein TrbI
MTAESSPPAANGPARKEDPERLVLRGRPPRVTRLNRRSLAILIGGLALCGLAATLWAFRAPSAKKDLSGNDKPNVDRVARAEGFATLPRDYASIPKPVQLGPPMGELGRPVLQAEQGAGLAPMPERPNFRSDPEEDAARAQRLRLQTEAEAAVKSPLLVQHGQRKEQLDAAPPPNSAVPSSSESASPVGTESARRESAATAAQEKKQKFISAEADPRIYASAQIQTPRSPAQLMAGTVIAAALLTGINSDLPGQSVATVTENVYDTVTGRLLLIPQGSRLLGAYDHQVAYGQRRVLLVWTRLLMPDGSSVTLDRLIGADAEGQSGLEDRVDWHLDRLASGAAVSSILGIAAALVTPNTGGTSGPVVIATRESVQDSVNQVGQEITRRNLDIQPTLTIRPGFPVRAIVNKDLILRPYGQ